MVQTSGTAYPSLLEAQKIVERFRTGLLNKTETDDENPIYKFSRSPTKLEATDFSDPDISIDEAINTVLRTTRGLLLDDNFDSSLYDRPEDFAKYLSANGKLLGKLFKNTPEKKQKELIQIMNVIEIKRIEALRIIATRKLSADTSEPNTTNSINLLLKNKILIKESKYESMSPEDKNQMLTKISNALESGNAKNIRQTLSDNGFVEATTYNKPISIEKAHELQQNFYFSQITDKRGLKELLKDHTFNASRGAKWRAALKRNRRSPIMHSINKINSLIESRTFDNELKKHLSYIGVKSDKADRFITAITTQQSLAKQRPAQQQRGPRIGR